MGKSQKISAASVTNYTDYELLLLTRDKSKRISDFAQMELYNRYKKLVKAYAYNLNKRLYFGNTYIEDIELEYTELFFEGIFKCDPERITNKETWKYTSYIAFVFRGYNRPIYVRYNKYRQELARADFITYSAYSSRELANFDLLLLFRAILNDLEYNILERLLQKMTQKDIASELHLSPSLVNNKIASIKQKVLASPQYFTNKYEELSR